MAEFGWTQGPAHGVCVVCGTSANDSGFVDMIGDTLVHPRDGGEISGEVRMIFCATCVLTASRLVGGASPTEVDELTKEIVDLRETVEERDKTIVEWQEKFVNIAALSMDDLASLNTVKANAEILKEPVPVSTSPKP